MTNPARLGRAAHRAQAYAALPTPIKKADAAPVVLVVPGRPQVFGMPDLLTTASRRHAEVYYLTRRPESQRADTERDLTKAGYPDVDSDHLFMRDKANPPAYLQSRDKPPSGPYCTTVQDKSQTRSTSRRSTAARTSWRTSGTSSPT